jgi:ankyrin repeat protein
MSKIPDRTLAEILQSTSNTLFPADLGTRTAALQSVDSDGDTPLHALIWRGDTNGAQVVIENGANVDAVGDMGETPLHMAIRKGSLTVVRALLEAGAKTDIVSEFGESAGTMASNKGIDMPHSVTGVPKSWRS